MTQGGGENGFGMLEMMVSLALMLLALTGICGMLVHNARINRSSQLAAETQANARNSLELLVQKLRSAGWDPAEAGIASVALDPDPFDLISEIEIFADLDGDGDTEGDDEQISIRHVANRIEWRRTATGAYETLAINISNDADGDGTLEAMFTPIPDPDPERIHVAITAEAPVDDPLRGRPLRYTVSADVLLRKEL